MPLVIENLTKSYGTRKVLDAVSFTATPGRVTGFLGPNGSGKTTTVRVALGLANTEAGTALFAGHPFRMLTQPGSSVGVLLENSGLHPGLTPVQHLRIAAAATHTHQGRITEVIDEVGLTDAATRKVRGFSQGMRQRLGLALALLANPRLLILDEPANGLDPEGMIWLRNLLSEYAKTGATVLVTSHVLNELERFIDDIVIITGGKISAQVTLSDLPTGANLEAFYLDTLRHMNQENS
ncbi:MAG: ATP-binding cassette domain-containing protein [Yaniella sp.]|uniref:Drug resistance ATP-binding protein n=1 Tax=Glutamicibacter arilaitensis (strain DSM 16368 / CIP 108037 / IAM 15318 / JCM 13566 / NCIMB 14258 / Re117) TaxID=861360 RepID=A0ABM9PTV0_GLUAR|nr:MULTISPECIES: ATP-binding cassette domain-containing protein [Micrococcaceae]MDN5816133.1 ATP-binding cassette domain-containing protein [Yaniella sp.]MDN5818207.1 ATP-binding cassette domain-containing protein [Yaniella sp.]MDN5838097.1 ATP-binding cassette domain-containing protein [Yaniella sp.]MDN5889109.1 ATP-binding cassette domain-containing protein [Yaniella sp.]MDN5912245.1 ATP-binding cassette domain-containing protein [Yaniella sp.]